MTTYGFHPFINEMDMIRIGQALDAHVEVMEAEMLANPEKGYLKQLIGEALRIKRELVQEPILTSSNNFGSKSKTEKGVITFYIPPIPE